MERAPLAEMADDILLGALAILREAAALRPALAAAITVSEVHRLSYAGSALWISAKTAGTRTSEWAAGGRERHCAGQLQ